MIYYLSRAQTLGWIFAQSSRQQVHELLIIIQSIALKLLQSLMQVFHNLLLLANDLFDISLLDTKKSVTKDVLAINSQNTALQRHPNRATGDNFKQYDTQGPHIKTPRLAF